MKKLIIIIVFVAVLIFTVYNGFIFLRDTFTPKQKCEQVLHYWGQAGRGYINYQCYPITPLPIN